MLNKFFMRAAVAAVALTCTTGSASAENYEILVLEFSFFSSVSYVQPGDSLTFVNNSGIDRDVRSRNANWFITDLADGASASIVVEDGWKNEYMSRIKGAGNGSDNTTETDINLDDASIDYTGDDSVEAVPGTIMGILNYSGGPQTPSND